MRISFFEEFPTKQNLSKIKYVDFPTKLYLAAHSVTEFEKISVQSPHVQEKIYWPILDKREGYWLSPFSNHQALQRILHELRESPVSVMWDAELPTTHNPALLFKELPFFFSNRDKIRQFISQRKNVSIAEYSGPPERMLYFLGLSFRDTSHYPIKMLYSSMHNYSKEAFRDAVSQAHKQYGKRLRIGLGTLAHGILGTEPMISSKMLERDLVITQDLGIEEVILFRLGGLNKEYARICKKFSTLASV